VQLAEESPAMLEGILNRKTVLGSAAGQSGRPVLISVFYRLGLRTYIQEAQHRLPESYLLSNIALFELAVFAAPAVETNTCRTAIPR
jgi:hypothetical protein